MEDVIRPEGFTPWGDDRFGPRSARLASLQAHETLLLRPVLANTTFYAEFNSTGPGGDTSGRNPAEHLLTESDVQQFTFEQVFMETPSWIDYAYVY